MKALKKILIVLVIGALIAGAFMPMGSVAALDTTPVIQIDLTKDDIWMNGPTNVTGEYANENHTIMVRVRNTGNEYLKDIVLSCEVFSDAGLTTSVHAYTDMQIASLDIGAEHVFEFGNWSPYMTVTDDGIDNPFWIFANASGMGFEDEMVNDPKTKDVVIRNVTNVVWEPHNMFDTMGIIMTPYPYIEDMGGVETYNYSSANNQPQYNLKNRGNVDATVTVDVSGYDLGSGTPEVADHTDTDNPTIAPGMVSGWTDFPGGTWDLSTLVGDGLINVSVSGADFVAANTTHEFMVADHTDVTTLMPASDLSIKYGIDLESGTATFNTTAVHEFRIMVLNNGNQDISTDFHVLLNASKFSGSGPVGNGYNYGYQLIDAGTTTLAPGDASPEAWTQGVTPPGSGQYVYNFTAPMIDSLGEFNTTNNMTQVMITFEDTEGLLLEITSPMEGKYPVMNMDINATVTNDGTLDFADMGGCNVSLVVYDNNMTLDTSDDVPVWTPADIVIDGLEMTMSTWADWTWTGAEGGMEYLIVLNATAGTQFMEKSVTVTFPHPNGTVSGIVTPNMADIVVSAYDGPTMIASTMTEASGFYTMSLEAIAGMYNITVTAPYGYNDAWNATVMVYDDGRTTLVDFDLTEPPKGTVNGTITLMEEGMPVENLDYTDITVAVDGTPLSVMANDVGNYTIPGILPGIVNVTASKTGFTTAWNESVDVVALMTTMYVNLTLYEDWGVMVVPAHGDMDVANDTTVTVTFEEDINKTTVNLTNTFDVMDSSDVSVAGSIAWADNMSFVFTPDANLTWGETYTIWIETGVMSTMDMAVLHRDWLSEFTILTPIPDDGTIEGYVTEMIYGAAVAVEGATVTSGTVSGVTDADGMYSIDVAEGTGLGVTATKYKYDDATVTGIDVVAAATTGDQNITMTPMIDIDVSVMVSGTSTDVSPETDALADVDVDTALYMAFDEAINTTSLNFFTVEDSTGTDVAGAREWNATSMIVTFTPTENLTEGETYTLTIMDTATNETGAAILPRDVEWMFTAYAPDITVTATITPADGATGVLVDAVVTIAFDYEMNTTAAEAAITAAFGTGYTWTADNKTVTIAHADWTEGSIQTVSVGAAALSVEGYATTAATSTFTVWAPDVDTTADLDIGPINDKDGNPLSGATVTLTDPDGNSETATTGADGIATFSFTDLLPSGTYDVKATASDYEDDTWTITYDNVTDTWTGPGTGGSGRQLTEKEDDDDDFDWLPVILIIIVIVIIVILLALAMKPKKAAEEELEEEEAEEEEGAEGEEFECPECGAAVSSGEAICPECGAEFEEEEFECPECGAQLEAGAGTCAECGAEFEAEEAELEEGEEGEEAEDEELEDYEIEEEEEFEEEMEEGEEEMEDEEMEDEEMEEVEESEEELPDEEEELPGEEEAEEVSEEVSEEEEEELD